MKSSDGRMASKSEEMSRKSMEASRKSMEERHPRQLALEDEIESGITVLWMELTKSTSTIESEEQQRRALFYTLSLHDALPI